jgi:hypothetical protein
VGSVSVAVKEPVKRSSVKSWAVTFAVAVVGVLIGFAASVVISGIVTSLGPQPTASSSERADTATGGATTTGAGAALAPLPAGAAAALAGNEAAVAAVAIRNNFDTPICPSIVSATRESDGTIRATCSDGAAFRVFTYQGIPMAMSCSALAPAGIQGC